jgi:hypothetical protein
MHPSSKTEQARCRKCLQIRVVLGSTRDDRPHACLDGLVSSAATGTFHGADGISCVAGSTPCRISRWTEPTQIFSRCAVSSMLMVSMVCAAGS